MLCPSSLEFCLMFLISCFIFAATVRLQHGNRFVKLDIPIALLVEWVSSLWFCCLAGVCSCVMGF